MELRGTGLFWWKYGFQNEVTGYQATLGIKTSVSPYSLLLDRSSGFYMIRGGDFISGAERDGSYAYFTAFRGGVGGLFRQPLSSAENSTPQNLIEFTSPSYVSMGPIGRSGSDLYFAPSYASGYTSVWRASFNDAGDSTGVVAVAAGDLHPYPCASCCSSIPI